MDSDREKGIGEYLILLSCAIGIFVWTIVSCKINIWFVGISWFIIAVVGVLLFSRPRPPKVQIVGTTVAFLLGEGVGTLMFGIDPSLAFALFGTIALATGAIAGLMQRYWQREAA